MLLIDGCALFTLHTLNSPSDIWLLLFLSKPLTSTDPTLSTQLSFHPSSSSLSFPPTLPVFPLVSPAVSLPVSSCTPPSPHLLFCLHFFIPTAPYWKEKAPSLSSVFASELILTRGYSPEDERWVSAEMLHLQPTIPSCVLQSGKKHPQKKGNDQTKTVID